MIPGSEEPTTAPAHDSSDETIELELTREQGLALSRAAQGAAARPDEPRSVFDGESFTSGRTARIDFAANVTFVVAVLATAVVFLWPASTQHRLVPTVPVATPRAAAPAPSQAAEPQGAPVRMANAFDATEVFEFPYGTTESQAKVAVAELLLGRARERRAERLAPRRAASPQPETGAAGIRQPEVFVTRLLARRDTALNGTN